MQPIFQNKTLLTEDLYVQGIKEYYKIGHRISRAIGVAYGIVIAVSGGMMLYDLNFVTGIPFIIVALMIFVWYFWGYLWSTKKSFKKFAGLHESHYQVEMDFRFYENRLEQETERTELGVDYKDITDMYIFSDILIFVYNRNVIIMDRKSFVRGSVDEIIALMKQNNVKIKYKTKTA